MKAFKKPILILFGSILFCSGAIAQFQKKFTIDLGVSYLYPSKEKLRDDRLPYLFSNFENGYGVYANLLYNLSRKFSVGIAANLSSFRSWKDPRTEGTGDNSYFNVYSIDPNIKYKIFDKRVSLFVMAGAGASVYHAKRAMATVLLQDFYLVDFQTRDLEGNQVEYNSIDQVLLREPGFEIKPTTAFNVLGAMGLDIKISETIGLTLMACYNISLTSSNFTLDQDLKYLSFPIGVNLSLGKSKTL